MCANSSGSPPDGRPDRLPEEAEHRHHRTGLFYGAAGFERIGAARVLVVGLGGVGGHAAVNLGRSGVGALHLVDFDDVSASSLNRSAFALPADVGRPKTEVLAAHLAAACPETRVTFETVRCDRDRAADLVGPDELNDLDDLNAWSVVLDAIDSVGDKLDLLEACRLREVPVISSMGAAAKSDVAQVQTGRLSESRVCPLARQMRLGLKRREVPLDIPCVWSTEKVRPDLARPLPSQMSLPGVFGYALASLALERIANEENR